MCSFLRYLPTYLFCVTKEYSILDEHEVNHIKLHYFWGRICQM